MNYPENMNHRYLDEEKVDPEVSEAEECFAAAHEFYKSVLATIAKQAVEHRFLLKGEELELMMDGLMDHLSYERSIADAMSVSDEHDLNMRVYPHDAAELCEAASEEIFDAWRIKPIDYSAALMDALRPVATNPATTGFQGGDNE